MTEEIARVPGWPLAIVVFWGAAAFFALAMWRHLRVLLAVSPSGPFPLREAPRRVWAVIEHALIQVRMFRDPPVAIMHHAIFWGFVLLTVGTANAVTGGLVQAIVQWPLDGLLWAAVNALQNVMAIGVISGVAYALWRRLVTKPPRLHYSNDALIILGLIGGLVSALLISTVFESARFGDIHGAFISNALAPLVRRPAARASSRRDSRSASGSTCWRSSTFLVYLPGSKHLHIFTTPFNAYLMQARAARGAAGDGPRARGPDVRAQDARGPRLEGPARRVHVHRVRPLPGRVSCVAHRESR